MLSNVDEVVRTAGALLDDPGNSWATLEYMRPHIDLCYERLDVQLEQAGLQYIESLTVVDVPAGTIDLASMMEDGGPLADMKLPRRLSWKLPEELASAFKAHPCALVIELSNPDVVQGVPEWRNANGAIQINASIVDVQLQIAYDRMSTTMYDPYQQIVRGTAHILSQRVAAKVAGLRRGMEKRAAELRGEAEDDWRDFKAVLVKGRQGITTVPRTLHGRRRNATPFIAAPLDDSY